MLLREILSRFSIEKVTINSCDIPTTIEAFRLGLIRDSPMYYELKKYSCKTMDDVQVKVLAHVRLEEDKKYRDDTNYHPNRNMTTHKKRNYKPYNRF